jgi:hypothetical protein
MLNQQPATELQKGLIRAHPGASAASQHESGDFRVHDVFYFTAKSGKDAKKTF